MHALVSRIRQWCQGRHWPGRAVLLLAFVYLGVRYLLNAQYHSVFDGINLGIHEAGHLLFRFMGNEFLYFAGGTILQLAAPVAAMIMFWRQPDYFATAICGCWLSTNLYGVATYVGDARAQGLPLVTVGGGDAVHDWHYLLGRLDMLALDTTYASILRFFAFVGMWGGIAAGAWLLYLMVSSHTNPRHTDRLADWAERSRAEDRITADVLTPPERTAEHAGPGR
jgi:hypothetical protein